MRFGCCGSLVAQNPDKTGVEIVEKIAQYGYDYIELPLAERMELSDADFAALCKRVERSGIRCEACNNFFPGRIRLTGPDVDEQAIRAYYANALERAATLGVKAFVVGSAGAKRVPESSDMDRAYQQVVQVTRETGEAAAKYGIKSYGNDCDGMIKDPEVEAVVITSIDPTHHDYVMKTLAEMYANDGIHNGVGTLVDEDDGYAAFKTKSDFHLCDSFQYDLTYSASRDHGRNHNHRESHHDCLVHSCHNGR